MKEISHTGRILSVGPEITTVEILSKSACSSCQAAGLCTAFEAARKEVAARSDPAAGYQVGDEVEVVLRQDMGTKAVVLAYVVPLFILLILVVYLSYTSISELAAGAIGLGGVALWYAVLWCFRGSLNREYNFYIRRK